MNAHSRNILGKRENCALFEHEQSLFLSLKARAFERRTYERCALIDCSPEVSCERSSMKPCYVSQTILLVSRWSLHYHQTKFGCQGINSSHNVVQRVII